MTLPLDKQVVSLPIAKKLKELGCKQKSSFFWVRGFRRERNAKAGKWIYIEDENYYLCPKEGWQLHYEKHRCHHVSAYTVAELGEMLPKEVRGNYLQICRSFDDGWFVGYGDHMNLNGFKVEDGKTEADARGKMLIYLLENKIVDPKSL